MTNVKLMKFSVSCMILDKKSNFSWKNNDASESTENCW
jgi:hypothetical protein